MKRSLKGLLLGILGVGGCVTPSIPLPPPVLDALTFNAPGMGTVELAGRCAPPVDAHKDAKFFAYNMSRGAGAIALADAQGCFTSEPFAGTAGDLVEIWYEKASKRSEMFECTLTIGVNLSTTICH